MLAELDEEFGERMGFLGLLHDYGTNRHIARMAAETAGVSFINISSDTAGLEVLMEHLSTGFVPTSVIIDREGNVLQRIIGSPPAGYRGFVEDALAELSLPD